MKARLGITEKTQGVHWPSQVSTATLIPTVLLALSLNGQADIVAYDDCAWTVNSGQNPSANDVTGSFTTNSPMARLSGHLINSANATQLAMQVSFNTNSALNVSLLDRAFAIPSNTDASTWFAGHIGTNCAANWTAGTIQMTVSGLNADKLYNMALWSTRGADGATYSNRFTDIVLTGADSFENHSSAGAETGATWVAGDFTRIRSALTPGRIARYDNVEAGSDGTVIFALTAGADLLWSAAGASTNGYLNAFLVQETTNSVPRHPPHAEQAQWVPGSNAIRTSWSCRANHLYRIMKRTSLLQGAWQYSGIATASVETLSIDMQTTGASAYYRLEEMAEAPPMINNGNGAALVGGTTAILNGDLGSTGEAPTSVYVCWDTLDRGTVTTGQWAHVNTLGIKTVGAFTHSVTGLITNTTYYYRCYAVNTAGASFASSAATFTTIGADIIPSGPFIKMVPTFYLGDSTQVPFTYQGKSYNAPEHIKGLADMCVTYGLNTVAIGFGWDEMEPTNGVFNWSQLDGAVYYCLSKGVRPRLNLWFVRYLSNRGNFFTNSDEQMDYNERPLSLTVRTISFASPRYIDAVAYARTICDRYKSLIGSNQVLVSAMCNDAGEWSYQHTYSSYSTLPDGKTKVLAVGDYNPYMIAEFRQWLSLKYSNSISVLNQKWSKSYASFDVVAPPEPQSWNFDSPEDIFDNRAGWDWYQFRDQKITWALHYLLDELSSIPELSGKKFLMMDYGSTYDNQVLCRGSANFKTQCDHPAIMGIQQNPLPNGDMELDADVVGSISRQLGQDTTLGSLFPRDYEQKSLTATDMAKDFARLIQHGEGMSFFGIEPGHYEDWLSGIRAYLQPRGLWDMTNALPRMGNNPRQVTYRVSQMVSNSISLNTLHNTAQAGVDSNAVEITIIDDLTLPNGQ